MSTTQWGAEPGVMQRLLDEPYRFKFFQAVHLIELWLRQNGVPHDLALTDYLTFRNSTSLTFPASQIEALAAQSGEEIRTVAQLGAALLARRLDGIAITPSFMGFLGSGGVLPNKYTERIAAVEHFKKDDGPRALLDLFSTRALALFYQANAKYRVEFMCDTQGEDGYLPRLLMLAGISTKAARARPQLDGGLCDETLAYYAAVIRRRAVSGSSMSDVLAEYFGVPFEVVLFDGCWDMIPKQFQTTLLGANSILGRGATLGARRWTRDQRVRVRIGPLDKSNFNRFARGADGAKALEKLLSMFPCAPLKFRVQVVLRAQDVKTVHLGPAAPGKLGLGRDTFLTTRPVDVDYGNMQYDLRLW
jgi:type VI secretion system protein ImpH